MSLSETGEIGPDKDLVKVCSEADERSDPLVFVGREDTLQCIDATCRRAMWRIERGRNAAGKTFLVQGAPGAGKTSLLNRCMDLWAEQPRNAPYVLNLTTDVLKDISRLIRLIVLTVRPKWWRRILNCFGLQEVEVNVTASGSARIKGEDGIRIDNFDFLVQSIPPKKWKKPLCIIVDEIQNVGDEHKDCIGVLHEGRHGLPIVPIYAGLPDSTSVLVKLGISRTQIDNSHTLGALSSSETKSYVKQMLDRCRIDYTHAELDRFTDRIVKRSEGWPQHVHTETAALFWGLDQAGCDLAKVDHGAIEKRAEFYRKASYAARRSPEMSDSVHLVAAVLRELPNAGMHRSGVLKSIRDNARPEEAGWNLPEGMSAGQFRDHLIRKGVLQSDRNDMLICPIPSLRTWLMKQADNLQDPDGT